MWEKFAGVVLIVSSFRICYDICRMTYRKGMPRTVGNWVLMLLLGFPPVAVWALYYPYKKIWTPLEFVLVPIMLSLGLMLIASSARDHRRGTYIE